MTREWGPHAPGTAFAGIPEVVQIYSDEPSLFRVITLRPEGANSNWFGEQVGDKLLVLWGGNYWALRYELIRKGDSFHGVSWYWSHNLPAPDYTPKKIPTIWQRTLCPADGSA